MSICPKSPFHVEQHSQQRQQMKLQYVRLEGPLEVHSVCQRASFE